MRDRSELKLITAVRPALRRGRSRAIRAPLGPGIHFSSLITALSLAAACAGSAHRDAPGRGGAGIRAETLDVSSYSRRRTVEERDSALSLLERNRSRWAAARPRHYRYRENAWCFCLMAWVGPHVVTVRDGRVVSATDTTGVRTDPLYLRDASTRQAGGIDLLFDRVAAAIRDTTYEAVDVDYDTVRGYPSHVTFDRKRMATDDEFYVDVSRFEALP